LRRAKRYGDTDSDLKRKILCEGPVTTCGGGHCVALVGWNNTLGGWIIKNSWGTSWANQQGATNIGGGYGFIPWDHEWTNLDTQKYFVRGVRRM
jgi:Cysteine protease